MSRWMLTINVAAAIEVRRQKAAPVFKLLFELLPDFMQPEAGHVIEALIVYGAVADEQAPVLVAFLDDVTVQQSLRLPCSLLVLFQTLLLAMLPCHQGVLEGFKPLSAHALLGNEPGRYMQQTSGCVQEHRGPRVRLRNRL